MRSDLTTAVVECVAEADGVDLDATEFTLHDYIDPAILTKLDERDDDSWAFTFHVADHEVTVTSGGAISVDGTLYRNRYDTTLIGSEPIDRELEKMEQHYPDLLDSLPGVVYRCRNERNWPIEFVSEGFHQLTGYEPEAFIVGGASIATDVVHPDDREAVWENVQEALQAEEPFTHKYRIQTADGEVKRVWEKGTGVFEEGEVVALVGFITEITDIREEGKIPREVWIHPPK